LKKTEPPTEETISLNEHQKIVSQKELEIKEATDLNNKLKELKDERLDESIKKIQSLEIELNAYVFLL
jgi:hypothetical protein